MKYNSFFKLLTFAFVCAFLATSCVKEGPAGQDGLNGQDGAPGADGNITCLECHTNNLILEKEAQFVLSGHRIGEFTLGREEWSGSCVKCHTPVGFKEFAEFGEANIIGSSIENTETFDCNTCHGIHEDFEGISDFALRITSPVVMATDKNSMMDLNGNSNLCGNCHQARTAPPTGTEFKISSTHYGPHHGPQGNVVYGTGFAEIEGDVAYPAAGSSDHLEMASCIGCHMAPFDSEEIQGGHTYIPSVAACNDCHGADLDDYNYGGVQTQVAGLLEEIRDQLVELGVVEYIEADDAYEPVVGTYPIIWAQAYFNWIGMEEDRSMGVHNPKYVKALLQNTKQALEGEIQALAAN